MLNASLKLRPLLIVIATHYLAIQCATLSHAADGAANSASKPTSPLVWEKLAPIPNPEGLGYPFAGVHGNALLVAGGANFPNGKPWEGGKKVWHDTVFVLESLGGKWKQAGKLPRPLAYGVSISTPDGVACLGGSDAKRHYADCFLLKWSHGKLEVARLPSLPKPCANFTGVLLDHTIYVAGGIEAPNATTALHSFWSLDLSQPGATWQEREPWPGPGRMFATMGGQGGELYLFGGAALKANAAGEAERQWLTDTYRFEPDASWKQIADLPRPVVAAPTPAAALGQSQLLLFGGDDGAQAVTPPNQHRGFPREILAYHIDTNAWTPIGTLPFSFATTPMVDWHGHIVVPGGETRPGIRSNEVWMARIVPR